MKLPQKRQKLQFLELGYFMHPPKMNHRPVGLYVIFITNIQGVFLNSSANKIQWVRLLGILEQNTEFLLMYSLDCEYVLTFYTRCLVIE